MVTNARYAADFRAWSAQAHEDALPLVIHDDGTTSNEGRRGAIGDIAFVVEQEGWTPRTCWWSRATTWWVRG